VGHLAAWNYFQSVESDENEAFIARWRAFTGNDERVTNDPMEATYIGFKMWVEAVTAAGSTGTDVVEKALIGVSVKNLTGGDAVMNKNHHLSKPVLIGEIQEDGQFLVVSETEGTVPGDAWSNFLPGSKDVIADWTDPIACGNYNTVSKTCSGQNF
jgi:urea transport system substrate-binding protein